MSNRQRIHQRIHQRVRLLSSRRKQRTGTGWELLSIALLLPSALLPIVTLLLGTGVRAIGLAESPARLYAQSQDNLDSLQDEQAPLEPIPDPAPSERNSPEETVLSFQTDQYAVRIFRRLGDLRMNLYNRQTDKVEAQGIPMQINITDQQITFSNRGDRPGLYSIQVAPDGSEYRLIIKQGDRVAYSQRVVRALIAAPAPSPSPTASSPPAAPPASPPASPPPSSPSTSSRDLAPRELAPRGGAAALTDPSDGAADELDSITIAEFQTPKYAVRLYDQDNELRMNVYDRGTDVVELNAAPIDVTQSGQQTIYASSAVRSTGNATGVSYAVIALPVGGYRLEVRQGDRVIYDEAGY